MASRTRHESLTIKIHKANQKKSANGNNYLSGFTVSTHEYNFVYVSPRVYARGWDGVKGKEKQLTCITETKEIADPVSEGGLDNLELGLAEYAEDEAERTFKAYTNISQTSMHEP